MVRSGEMAGRSAERMPVTWAALAAALAVTVSPAALAQTVGTEPAAAPAPGQPDPNVLLEADQLIDDDLAKTITAEGDVQVRYRGRTMRADRIVYDLNTGSIHAIGNVQVVSEDGSTTYANEVEADEALNVGIATELRARLGTQGTLAARAALRHGEGASELRNIIYTSCPICEAGDRPPTWSLRARRAVQNQTTRTISYQGAVLDIVGVPVLYMPYFAHPDPTVGRASGFLTPDIGRNRRLGTFYDQPYYWAISPDQDLTASLRVHANVNPLAGLSYRKRFWSGVMDLDTTFTQERSFDTQGDRLGADEFRYSAFGKGLFRINDYWNWGFGLERIHDDEYLRRYDLDGPGERRGPYIGTATRLISQLYGIGQNEHSFTSLSFVSFQGLRADDTSDLLPLILPFAETEHVLTDPLLHGQVRLQANTAVLRRDDNPVTAAFEGSTGRVSLSATWRKDQIVGPGLVVSPFAQVRGDLYSVETSESNFETFARGLGLAGTEISWPFMRPGENVDFIVEPVAMVAYATSEEPDPRIVNEDSQTFELDDSDLFRPNGAPNYDLWEPGGRLSAGVRATARSHTGESASLTFGRRWRDEVAPGFPPISNVGQRASDWVGAASVDLGRNFGTEARIRLDDETFDVQRIDLGVRAAAGRFSVDARYFSIEHTGTALDPSEQVSSLMAVDLARGWRMQYGVTRDLDSDINLSQDIRAIYEDDCTYLEIAYTRSGTQRGTIGPDESIQFRIGFRSLGVFGGS